MIGRQALTPIAPYKSTGGKRTSEVWEVCHRNPGVQGVISTSLEGQRLASAGDPPALPGWVRP